MIDWWTLISKMNKWSLPPLTSPTRLMRLLYVAIFNNRIRLWQLYSMIGYEVWISLCFSGNHVWDSFYIDLIGSWFCQFVLIQGVGIAMALRKTTVDKTLVIKYKTQPKKKHREKKNSSTVVLQLLREHVRKTVEEFFFSLLFFLESFFVLIY